MRQLPTIELKPPLDDFRLMGKTLTLHLEDGRVWDFFQRIITATR
jgi:hypothetical protein